MLPRHTVNTFILDVVSLEYVVNLAMYQAHRGPLTSPKTAKLPLLLPFFPRLNKLTAAGRSVLFCGFRREERRFPTENQREREAGRELAAPSHYARITNEHEGASIYDVRTRGGREVPKKQTKGRTRQGGRGGKKIQKN